MYKNMFSFRNDIISVPGVSKSVESLKDAELQIIDSKVKTLKQFKSCLEILEFCDKKRVIILLSSIIHISILIVYASG